jgi:hypothetical protein
MKRSLVLALAVTIPVAACDGFKEAMTAHVDVAARAGSQELSVTRLSDLLGASKIPLRRDVVETVAGMWVNYQLLARAAAHDDSLNQPALIDAAMWPASTNSRVKKWYDIIAKNWVTDTAGNAAAYATGKYLAARHILFNTPPGNSPAADSALRKAQQVRSQLTSANFADMATKYNQPNAAGPGGDLGVFPKEQMVPEFSNALAALKPGEISQPVRSQFGYHLIRRSTYDEVREQFAQLNNQAATRTGESTYVAKLEEVAKIQVKPNAPAVNKGIAADPDAHKDDKTVVATTARGDLTAARIAQWIPAMSPNAQQLRQQIQQVPDSVLPNFVKAVARNDLLLRQADSAKITLDTAETNEIRRAFVSMVANTWAGLGIAPNRLADSAKTVAERERLAAARVDGYMERLLTKDEQFVQVPPPLESALHSKYDFKVNSAGIDRALERAQRLRAVADSTRAAQQPQSAVPIPGQPGAPTPKTPTPAPDSTAKKP